MNLRNTFNKYNLIAHYRKAIFDFRNFLDPMPKRNKDESDYDYFDRIDPKYGLRYYGYHRAGNVRRDIGETINSVNQRFRRAKDRKLLKRFFLAINKMENNYDEGYKRYQIRSEIFKKDV